MSMTREEAIVWMKIMFAFWVNTHESAAGAEQAKDLALSALRPVSREQVRRGTIIETIKDGRANRVFSCCGHDFTELTCWFMPDFCPSCGAPMTDEAVEMVMERLEALHETVE